MESQKISERIAQLKTEFEGLPDWERRYQKIIEMGKLLPVLPDQLKTEESKIRGCQSQVWLHAQLDSDGSVQFQGDSDALLVKGLVALILKVYSGSSPKEILDLSPGFVNDLGLSNHLSPSRANGLSAMIKQIRNFAIAFSVLQARPT